MNRESVPQIVPAPLRLAALVGAFALTDALLATTALAQAPDIIQVPGIVRDFQKAHPDFNVIPLGGFGHYAGCVSTGINADQTPNFSGSGFRVNTEWTNKNLKPIAPHIFLDALTVPLGSVPILDAGATADTWDSTVGDFSSQVPGPVPTYNTSAPMPSLSEPVPFPLSVGDVSFLSNQNGNPPNTITNDIHCDDFSTQQNVQLVINGNVTILCDGDFNPNKNTHITLTPGSTLNIYFYGLFRIHQGSSVNMPPENSWDVMIYNLGTTQMEINQGSAVCAIIYSPDANLHLAQGDQFFGKYVGSGLKQDQFSGFHWDISPWRDACMNTIEDIAGAAGGVSPGGITSAATFDEWFNDILGTNLSQIYVVDMVLNGAGVYETAIAEFHPIDDRLFGNEGEAHNYFFTYEFNANFIYNACSQQFFEFQGSDDAWLFIDGQLVMDLGGVIPGTSQFVEMDRLNLTDGDTYHMKFFFAQRQMVGTTFNLSTNTVLLPPVITATGTGGFD
ncbi:MAG: fibro-slime domain-containing protein [Planctomycetota bacterium]|nr:fibro-slime domain-containing protein [Planctomycetota bacterium]